MSLSTHQKQPPAKIATSVPAGLFGAGMHSAIIDQALVGRELVKASLIPGFLATIAWFIWIRSSQLTGAR